MADDSSSSSTARGNKGALVDWQHEFPGTMRSSGWRIHGDSDDEVVAVVPLVVKSFTAMADLAKEWRPTGIKVSTRVAKARGSQGAPREGRRWTVSEEIR